MDGRCVYTADGRYGCPTARAAPRFVEPFVVEPFEAFVPKLDSPQIYLPDDVAAAIAERGSADGARGAATRSVENATRASAAASKADQDQQSDWATVQTEIEATIANDTTKLSDVFNEGRRQMDVEKSEDDAFAKGAAVAPLSTPKE